MKKNFLFCIITLLFVFCFSTVLQANTGYCAPKKIKMNVKRLTLAKNETYTLRIYNMKKKQTVTFSSDDENIVFINEPGTRSKTAQITAANIGSTTVRANIYSKKNRLIRTIKTHIKVTPFGFSIKFTQKRVRLDVTDTLKLSVIIKPNTSEEVPIYESSDPDVATVNSKGIVTAISPGQAEITATLLSTGQKVKCIIDVELNAEKFPEPLN